MRFGVTSAAMFLVVALSLRTAPAAESFASYGGTADLEARIAALEAHIAAQQESTAQHPDAIAYLPEAGAPACCGDGSCGCCDSCRGAVGRDFLAGRCRTAGFYGGAEIMWLMPFSSGITPVIVDGSSANAFLPGWRLWGGAQNCDGLGWRVNWWQWDHSSSGTSDQVFDQPTIVDTRIVFQKLDLLATQMVSFRRWDLMLLGGVTYAGNGFNSGIADPDGPQFIRGTARFDGWGLTTGLLAYRDVPRLPGLQGFGGVQWSGIYGNSVLSETDGVDFQRLELDGTLLNVVELKVGTQYERSLGAGAIGFVSAGFEAQYWAGLGSPIFGELFLLNGNSLGLVGFTVGTGVRR